MAPGRTCVPPASSGPRSQPRARARASLINSVCWRDSRCGRDAAECWTNRSHGLGDDRGLDVAGRPCQGRGAAWVNASRVRSARRPRRSTFQGGMGPARVTRGAEMKSDLHRRPALAGLQAAGQIALCELVDEAWLSPATMDTCPSSTCRASCLRCLPFRAPFPFKT